MTQQAKSRRRPRTLLTGRPGSGKTTVIRSTVERIGRDRCAGFYTEEVRDGGRRAGFEIVTLDGRRAPLARAGAPGPRVGRYGVQVEVFERVGVAALEEALAGPARVLVVDEIGKMELLSERFVRLLQRVFEPEGDAAVLGTIMRGRDKRLGWLEDRDDVQRITVTPANREELPKQLAPEFRAFLSGGD